MQVAADVFDRFGIKVAARDDLRNAEHALVSDEQVRSVGNRGERAAGTYRWWQRCRRVWCGRIYLH